MGAPLTEVIDLDNMWMRVYNVAWEIITVEIDMLIPWLCSAYSEAK